MATLFFMSFKSNMYNVSFLGLKENIAYGHQAIAEVKKDFPTGLRSNTYYETFADPVEKDVLYYYQDLILTTRALADFKKRQGMSSKQATFEAVNHTGAANCGEQSFLVSQKLDEMGIQNKIISMNIRQNSKFSNFATGGHTFCVIDTDKNMDINNPDTWGKDAVVVDMWSNTVAKVKDAIEFFGTFLKPKENERVLFETVDPY